MSANTTERLIKARRYLAFFILFFALLFMRRSAQLLNPQVWDEDGTQIVPGLIDHGLKSLLYPVNGYLVVLPKLISAISLAISGLYYPLVSTLITWFSIVCICMAISLSPTWLKGGALIGIVTLLIPADPEVFGIPLYTFWWSGLLLFLVVLWKPESIDLTWRIAFVLIGGLSSPVIFLVTPFLLLRAGIFSERRRELVVTVMALACCGVQAVLMLYAGQQIGGGTINRHSLHNVVPKFIGGYLANNFRHATSNSVWFAAGIFIAFLIFSVPVLRTRPWYFVLIGLWAGAIFLVARRIDLSLLHSHYAGPRYFFLPFVLMSWFLLSATLDCKRRDIRCFAAGLLLVSVLNMLPVRTRTHQDLQWAEHVRNCAQSDEYSIPISWDGGQRPWFLVVNRHQCAVLQHAGFIHIKMYEP